MKKVRINAIVPFEQHPTVKYYYIKSTDDPNSSNLNLKCIVNQFKLYSRADIPITQNETVNMILKISKNGRKTYTMQYRDDSRQLKIRTDNPHDYPPYNYPHIDIEMAGESKQKIKLNSERQDYEASINTILRYVEKNYNRLVGPTYWLLPSVLIGSGKTIIRMFDAYQEKYNINTAFTDIARFVSIDVIIEISNGRKLKIQDYSRIIHSEFRKCKEIEGKNGGIPLEVKATDIYYPNGVSLLPFPVILPLTSYNMMMPLTQDGKPSEAKSIVPAGIVAELQKE